MPRRALIPWATPILAAALGLAGCFGGGAPPPPAPSGGGDPTSPAGPPVACQGTGEGETSLVTVEATPNGPDIKSTPVSSKEEADAVVAEAAADGDLIAVEADLPRAADVVDDPLRPQQWALTNVAFEDAWTTGGSEGDGQVVAVVDTGVYAAHEDLNDGRVLPGRYFLHSDDGSAAFEGPGGTTDPNGHGTHVAGIIAAETDNATGVAGAAPGVDILPVQVLCDDGKGFSSDVAKGITWAANNGADVINLSLGGSFSSAEQLAIQHARGLGVVVVASAGNSGNSGNAPSYPGAFPEVIGVAALLETNARASYSTVGGYVDIAAPGGASTNPPNSAVGILSTWNNGGYAVAAGTSMASPHVAAAAALVRAVHGFTTHADVCNQLIRTADDLGAPGFDNEYGNGRVDPLEAVGSAIPAGLSCT